MVSNDVKNIAAKLQKKYAALEKEARIRKLPNGKYRVLSEKGKNLGTFPSRSKAKKHLREVEYFKHKDKNKSDDTSYALDFNKVDDLSYSSIMRHLRQKEDDHSITSFLYIFKQLFDTCFLNDETKDVMEKILPLVIFIFSTKHKTNFGGKDD